jgi:hypothetical protein
VTFIFPRSWLSGLMLSAAGGTTTFGVTAGQCADSTNAAIMNVPAALTKTVSSAWSEGNGGGALDTGSTTANTWYHVFAISDAVGVTTDILVSRSPTAPTLPAGFTLFRRIGSMKTDASFHWLGFVQTGDLFNYNTAIVDLGATIAINTITNVTLTVPTGIVVVAWFSATWISTNAVETSVNILPKTMGMTGSPMALWAQSNNFIAAGHFNVPTDTSGRIQVDALADTGTLGITTLGYRDRRGTDG